MSGMRRRSRIAGARDVCFPMLCSRHSTAISYSRARDAAGIEAAAVHGVVLGLLAERGEGIQRPECGSGPAHAVAERLARRGGISGEDQGQRRGARHRQVLGRRRDVKVVSVAWRGATALLITASGTAGAQDFADSRNHYLTVWANNIARRPRRSAAGRHRGLRTSA
jgi:hypothetical protein